MEIQLSFAQEALLLLTVLAGAAHVFSPDHWMPVTLVAWRKGWAAPRLLAFLALALGIHVTLGFGLYLIFLPLLNRLTSGQVLGVCLGLIALGSLLRSARFPLVRDVFLKASVGLKALGDVLVLLGPAEILVTVLYKSREVGLGYLLPSLAFFLGSLIVGSVLSVRGRQLYNHPGQLPQALLFSEQRLAAALPVGACLVLGLALILRVSFF
jgi:hypothetical protein